MFDKFTNRAKQVIKLAKKEAQRLNHNYLGTEHVLLGLLKLGQGLLSTSCATLIIDYDAVRAEVEKVVGFGPEIQVYGDPALREKLKKFSSMPTKRRRTSTTTTWDRASSSRPFAPNRWCCGPSS